MKRLLALAISAVPLGACTTTSFAPPALNPARPVSVSDAGGCKLVPDESKTIAHDVRGATDLIDTFLFTYRCAEHQLANGRTYFEIPSFLAALSGVLAPSFGAGPRTALGIGAVAGVSTAANSYFVPKQKAGIVGSATRAVVCIKSEAAGVSAYVLDRSGDGSSLELVELGQRELDRLRIEKESLAVNKSLAPARAAEIDERIHRISMALSRMTERMLVEDPALAEQEKYFALVSAALFSVEAILSERLRGVGSTDTTAIVARLKELAQQQTEAETLLGRTGGQQGLQPRQRSVAVSDLLQSKLQTCVLQARA